VSQPRRVSGTTRTVGVIAWPAAHSLSPAIHNAAFGAMDLDWVYLPLPVPPGSLAAAFQGLVALGFVGANVTMPHKTEAAELIADLSEDARQLHAVNTIVVGSAGLEGHNTDGPGFTRFLDRDVGFDPAERTALLFGAGGAARACALALARGGLAGLTVAVRNPAGATQLLAALEGHPCRVRVIPFAKAITVRAELLVNATPVGGQGDSLPLPPLGPETLVVDLRYRPTMTPLLEAAKVAGAPAFGGLGLLLHQAALSFHLWTGKDPSMSVMSAAALAELAEAPGPASGVAPAEPVELTDPTSQ
jgi:shikimate dehydrogenase